MNYLRLWWCPRCLATSVHYVVNSHSGSTAVLTEGRWTPLRLAYGPAFNRPGDPATEVLLLRSGLVFDQFQPTQRAPRGASRRRTVMRAHIWRGGVTMTASRRTFGVIPLRGCTEPEGPRHLAELSLTSGRPGRRWGYRRVGSWDLR